MNWLPFDAFEIEVPGTPDEVSARLARSVKPLQLLQLTHGSLPFAGVVDGAGFRVRLSTGQKDSVAPVMHGRFHPTETGTTVLVEMIPTTAILFVVVILMACMVQLLFRSGPMVTVLCAAAALSSWLLTMTCFWFDGGRSKRLLVTLLSNSPTGPSQ
jgi:hypothetical protein